MTKWLKASLLIAMGFGLLAGVPTGANATSKGHVVATTKVAKKAYHATKQSPIYTTTSLKKVRAKANLHTTYYVTKQATIKHNGKKAVYQYVTAKQVKGWLKKTSLKAGKVVVKSKAFKVAAANQAFLTEVNHYRQQHGTAAIQLDSQYQALAMQRAKELYQLGFEQYDHQDRPYAQLDAKQLGISFQPNACPTCLYGNGPISESVSESYADHANQAKVAAKVGKAEAKDLLYKSVEGSWDNRENLVRANSTKMGIGWYDHGGDIYLAVNAEVTPLAD
ncbi:hypothetical protein LZY01_22140 [Levilactobacillus zymae]|uniref:SCP domain-containing protein n=1 Tax=Levilactobacillus zymae TaxID=267363 RepID=A0ABQ0WZ26_9LACO|nr:CAP domain-containing protein [Levilactobacillus zymae]KRL13678.1 hypothetical protein FD38_GL001157 [Levilactobacillus zymae DSM 19395]QFR62113.1 hypothetical protein LZ395_11470 [Levilactobacillus zymae]GEO73046.1 hypothetical protein LZY01_22140 [Levilactobacillus zymae]